MACDRRWLRRGSWRRPGVWGGSRTSYERTQKTAERAGDAGTVRSSPLAIPGWVQAAMATAAALMSIAGALMRPPIHGPDILASARPPLLGTEIPAAWFVVLRANF